MAGKTNLIDVTSSDCFIILATCLLLGCSEKSTLQVSKILDDYSSGSGIEYFNEHFYLIGDDASYLQVLDQALDPTDTINLYISDQKRIPRDIKADLESITTVKNDNTPNLLVLGSGSGAHRNTAWLINPSTKEKISISQDTFYRRLLRRGIEEINIEGVARSPGGLVLVNRGNKSHPKNYLIFTSPSFWKNQATAPIKLVQTGVSTDTSGFNGISGLDYSARRDRLILSVSTEDTYNNYTDGAIGKSYLWIINDLSSKRRFAAMNPDKVIDLTSLDKRFEGQKIESVCIISETGSEMDLLLVADNDNGKTVLFKIRLAL